MELILHIIGNLLILLAVVIFIISAFDPYNSVKYSLISLALIAVSVIFFALEGKIRVEKAVEYAKELKKAESLICEKGWLFPEKVYVEKFKVKDGNVIDLKTGNVLCALDCKPEGEEE